MTTKYSDAKCTKCGNTIHMLWLGGELVLYHCDFCNKEFVTTLNHAIKEGHMPVEAVK